MVLIGLLCSLPSSPSSARVVEQVVVVIDGEPYTLSNFKEYARTKMGREFPTGDLNQVGKEDREVLEQFITEKLLAAEVKLVGVRVSEEDVNHYIEQIKEKNRLGDEELQAALGQEGISVEKYRASIRAELEKSEIISRQVRKRVNITSEDVERYYRSNPARYMTQERVRLRHILFVLPERASPEREKEVIAKALEVRSRALAGEDFGELARSHTEGAGASAGGEIGWVTRGSLLGEIEEVAFNKLSLGEVSQPVRTSLGVHLIKLEARDPRRALPLSEVAGKIKEELYAKALEERFQKWLKSDLRKKHRVDVKLPGVVFRPEEEKKGTVDSLMASGSRRSKNEESGLLSYLNPLSYIFRTAPIEGEDSQGEMSGQNIVSLFGFPLFKTESVDDVPEDPLAPLDAADRSSQKSEESGGFFSSIWKAVNPFSSRP